ncbi:MAG: hypothetical protein QXR69_01480 [Conexivisphaerales archaeon]
MSFVYTKSLLLWSFVIALIPVFALIISLAVKSFYLLQYIHVLTGGTWTGFDLFMGLVMTRVMKNLDTAARVEVAKRLTPTTFFIMPSLASVAIASGIYLASEMDIFNIYSPWIIAAGIVVIILSGQGFGIFMPNGLRIFIELSKPKPDSEKISRLNMQNIRLAGSQAFFQVALILIMAHLAVY